MDSSSIGKRLDNSSRCLSLFAIIAAYSSLRLTLKHTYNLSVGCWQSSHSCTRILLLT